MKLPSQPRAGVSNIGEAMNPNSPTVDRVLAAVYTLASLVVAIDVFYCRP